MGAARLVRRSLRRAERAGRARWPRSAGGCRDRAGPGAGDAGADDAEAAAERILALHEIALGVAQTLDAQLMECCWVIVDRGGDVEALAERLPLTADEVRGRAATWAAARRNRDLRGLAMAKPREAMALVSGLSAAGVDAADAGDLAELVALPPRRRAARVRELAAAEAAAKAGRNPDDVARIEELEEAAAAPRLRSAPVSQALARLDEAEAALDDATETLHHRIAGGVPLPPQTRARLLRKGDAVAALVDALLDALRGEGET